MFSRVKAIFSCWRLFATPYPRFFATRPAPRIQAIDADEFERLLLACAPFQETGPPTHPYARTEGDEVARLPDERTGSRVASLFTRGD